MEQRLDADVIRKLVLATPEHTLFDWKRDFTPPHGDEAKGEIVKDIVAIANATAFSGQDAHIVYGAVPSPSDTLPGVTMTWDDANLQQLVASTTDAPITCLLYEVPTGTNATVLVLKVPRTLRPPHMISRDIGKQRAGQYLIRDGSRTRALTPVEVQALHFDRRYGLLDQVLERHGVLGRQMQAQANLLRALSADEERLKREMAWMGGLSPHESGL